mmetsp:Transcript_25639/g.36777  ORF Transcript_25639/g.36777 Transcript_25639/m.36777 type:complete len:176 (+) Transcript_25639:6-533(+)
MFNNSNNNGFDNVKIWHRLPNTRALPVEGGRIHVCVDGRFVTVFRSEQKLSAIDSICHHAGGPLTLGQVKDIEELGAKVVLCPWHKFMVNIRDGTKVYEGVDVTNGVPVRTGWRVGDIVQRVHDVIEDAEGLHLSLCLPTQDSSAPSYCSSDSDASDARCGKAFPLHCALSNTLK